MKKIFGSIFAAGISLISTNASAIVINEQITRYTTASSSNVQDVDFYTFSSTGGTVTFDVLEWGYGGNHMDSMVWLFSDDGSLDVADLISQNDDSSSTFGDGSTTSLDSWLSATVGAGNYIFGLGQCCNFGATDIVDGVQGGVPADLSSASIAEIYDYQLTVTGAVNNFQLQGANVPEPASIALLGLGLAGLGFSRKKKAA